MEERQNAVLELLSGKPTVEQIARRLGVHASTVEGWRSDALGGIEEALRRGSGKTSSELELERKNTQLESVVTKLSIQKCLLEQHDDTVSGERLSVNVPLLQALLAEYSDRTLILSVEIQRHPAQYERDGDDFERYSEPYVRYYLMGADGVATPL